MNQIRNLTELKLTNNMLEVAQGIRTWRRFRRAGSDASRPCGIVFFHEYGRRVGMVPRSSLKEGKKRQMVEKGTKTPKTNPKPNTQARRPTPPSCSLPYTLGETCETETSDN